MGSKDKNSEITITRKYTDSETTAFALSKILDGWKIKEVFGKYSGESFEYLYAPMYHQTIPYKGKMQICNKKQDFELEVSLESDHNAELTIKGPASKKEEMISFLEKIANYKTGEEVTYVILEEKFSDSKYYAMSGLHNLLNNKEITVLRKTAEDKETLKLKYVHQLDEFVPSNAVFEIKYKDTNYFISTGDSLFNEFELSVKGPSDKLQQMKEILAEIKKAIPHTERAKVVSFGGELVQLKDYTWADIGGLEEQKQKLEELVSWPLKKPDLLREKGVKAPKAILLYGPPGTGKTLVAKVIACETGVNFIKADAADITSKWYGAEEKNIKEMFAIAKKHSPAIIFLDEIDAIARRRDENTHEATQRAVNQFLIELDGISELEGVTVVAATNRPDILDPAFLRPGRFNNKIEISLPNQEARLKIYQIHSKNLSLAEEVTLTKLAATEGLSGADIANICNEAGYGSIRNYLTTNKKTLLDVSKEEYSSIKVTQADFEKAVAEALKAKEVGNGEKDKSQ